MGGSDSTLFCRSLDCHKSRTGGGCHRAAQYTPFILPLTAAACSAICPRLYGIAAGLAVLVLFYCASLCNMSILNGVVSSRMIRWRQPWSIGSSIMDICWSLRVKVIVWNTPSCAGMHNQCPPKVGKIPWRKQGISTLFSGKSTWQKNRSDGMGWENE